MPSLKSQNGYLFSIGTSLVLDGGDCCCNDCPAPANGSFSATAAIGAMEISETHYYFEDGTSSTNIEGGPGFDPCVFALYYCEATIKAGSTFDDFGTFCGTSFDNHVGCGQVGLIGPIPPKSTTVTADQTVNASFIQRADGKYVVRLPCTAKSSNCGPPTAFNITADIAFVPK